MRRRSWPPRSLEKSVTDLTRRKARAVFAVLTLAIAVASVGIFAVPSLMDTAMQKEVQAQPAGRPDAEHEAARADDAQLAALGRLPNVDGRRRRRATSRRASGSASGASEGGRSSACPTTRDQRVDVVTVESGAAPPAGDAC